MTALCGATGEVSDKVTELLKAAEAAVLPPRSAAEAGQLADLGERALSTLARRPKQTAAAAAAAVRCLGLIGGAEAERLIDTYLDHEAREVVDVLAQVTSPMRVAALAKAVLDPSLFRVSYEPRRHLRAGDLAELNYAVQSLNLDGATLTSAEPLERFKLLNQTVSRRYGGGGPRPAGRAHRAARALPQQYGGGGPRPAGRAHRAARALALRH